MDRVGCPHATGGLGVVTGDRTGCGAVTIASRCTGDRAAQSPSVLRLQELQPVAERVRCVEAVMPRELPIPGHLDSGRCQRLRELAQVAHEDAGMRLAGCRELLLDTEVDLDSPAPEPTSTARSQGRRLLQLERCPGRRPRTRGALLATGGIASLDVVQLGGT